VCGECRCSYHANTKCDGEFTMRARGDTQLVCPKLVCRVSHKKSSTGCIACTQRPAQGCELAQCGGCQRVWCCAREECMPGAGRPVECKQCKTARTAHGGKGQPRAARPTNNNQFRDGGAEAPRGGNQ
jgi:hypothetical protein